MAEQVTRFLDTAGKEWPTEVEADASSAQIANKEAVETFVKQHFPTKPNSRRTNPHASTACKAIYLWLGHSSGREFSLTA